jgi:hypothetical protein
MNSTNPSTSKENELWILGAIIAFVGTGVRNLGVNVQKYSFMKEGLRPVANQRPPIKQGIWWFGLFVVVFGSTADFVALGFAAQSIVAPIGSATLVANSIFAHFWLKEHITKRDLIATSFIITGSVMSVMFGDHASDEYTVSDLGHMFVSTSFLIYLFCCVLLLIAFYIPAWLAEPIKIKLTQLHQDYENASIADDWPKANQCEKEIAALEFKYKSYEKIHPLCYCAVSGIFGGQNILFGKIVAELFATTFRGDNQFIYFSTYFFVICVVCTIVLQMQFLAKALRFFDALYVVPVFQCFWIGTSTIAGACYFGEFDAFTVTQWIVFPISIFITLGGVYLLSGREMHTNYKFQRVSPALELDPLMMEEENLTPSACPKPLAHGVLSPSSVSIQHVIPIKTISPRSSSVVKTETSEDGENEKTDSEGSFRRFDDHA